MHVAQAQLLFSAFENTVVVFSPRVNQERGLLSTELNKSRDKQETIAPITHLLFHDITGVTVVMGCKRSRIRALLVQHSNGISGFDLIKTKGEGEATGQLFDSTECGGGAVEPVAQLRQHFIEQLSKKRYKKCCCCIIIFFKEEILWK